MADLSFSQRELTSEEASFSYDVSTLKVTSFSDHTISIVGQPKAMKAIEMGLAIDAKGYNIFVSGDPGTGRSTAIRLATQQYREDLSLMKDIAFVHNFHQTDSPVALTFAPGKSRPFLLAMREFVSHLKQELKSVYQKEERVDATLLSRVVTPLITPLFERFSDKSLQLYLKQVQQDIIDHTYLFENALPADNFFLRYSVNVLVDHSFTKERPLIFETHPTFSNLFGSLESPGENRDEFYLPFLSIRAGSLLRAAGGYIVISAEELLTVEGLWEAFKRFLTTNALVIQNATSASPYYSSVRPEAIPLALKVILVGSEESYTTFCDHDLDFLKLFKVSAEFDYSMKADKTTIEGTISFIKMVQHEKNLLTPSDDALNELLRYSAYIAESRDELTTQLSLLSDLLIEAHHWAMVHNKESITQTAILQAIEQRRYVTSVTEDRIFDEIKSGEMIIAFEGYKIGVVNGLAVLDRGSSSFGTPTVISATVAPGSEGIVNIEHEAGLSGEIHDKGLLILEGYLRKQYARNFPLSIYSGICFEQSYAEIDGDSASSSELYALLSAIGEIPIKQNIAVTGSVNQMGELQPVGGINEKITGFYTICKRLNLQNHPGVMIPKQNMRSLILPYEIIEAIKKREFHIYPIETIDEGMQILTDRQAGIRTEKGNFPPSTLNRIIEDRLKHLYELSRPQN